ncbi:MAG: Gfo/Idh/MocA family oxidoreductase [Planctomycetota bacterium]|nr:Gfo/Idh/MocA family oxidoreductase [Planctomycetota bacterium]
MSKRLRLALIGAGHMGKFHAQAIAERADAELAVVCDVDMAWAAQVAEAHGARVETDVSRLAGAVDAAVIAAATSAHRDLALTFLAQGVALLIEKPLAGTPREAREIAEAAKKADAVVQVGHILRFDPVTRAIARRAVKPAYMEVSWASPFPFRSTDVGVVMDLLIHGLDVVLHLAGEMPSRIDAVGGAVVGPHEDFVNVRLEFPGGCVATLAASRMSRSRQRLVRLFAEGMYLKLDYAARTVEIVRPKPGLAEVIGSGKTPPEGMDALVAVEKVPVETQPDALRAQLASFLAAVRGEAPVAVTAEDGARAVEVAAQILCRCARGSPKTSPDKNDQ